MTMGSPALDVMHVISTLGVGGAERMLAQVASALQRLGFRNVVVALGGPMDLRSSMERSGVRVVDLGMCPGVPDLRGLVRLVRCLRQFQPAVLQTWLYHADLLGTIATMVVPGPALVWNLRCSQMDLRHYRPLTRFTRWACARLSARPAVIVANSRAGRASHAHLGYHPRAWIHIPNGVDTRVFTPSDVRRRETRAALGVTEDEVLIGLIARYDPMKGHAPFLRAARQLVANGVPARFLMVGEGVTPENASVTEIIGGGELADRILLMGRRDDVPTLLSALDIATSASVFGEGFPNAVAEAMACAVPCVVTDVGDSAEIVGPTGVVVRPGDHGALEAGWRAVLSLSRERRTELGEAARARIEARYSLDASVAAYARLYERVAAGRLEE